MDIFSAIPFLIGAAMPYYLIMAASAVIILSFMFGEVAKKTSIPSVLMLIVLGILIKLGLDKTSANEIDFFPILEILGIVG
ncbi:MAG: hypothetical protein AAGJ18_22460, partial [Bacteroidota bacterium]